MYNITYINSFDEKEYLNCLNDINRLNDIKANYLERYNRGVNVEKLALKYSLDHYVSKKTSENPDYINTTEFKTYINYIRDINNQKRYIIGQNIIYPELSTNVIFEYLSEEMLNKLFPKNTIKNEIEKNNHLLNDIFDKMKKNQNLDFIELEIISDYLDNNKNAKDQEYIAFISFIIENKDRIKMTARICSAFLAYITKLYRSGVENSRTYLGQLSDNGEPRIAYSSGNYPYTCFDFDTFKDIDLNSFESINKSRTFKKKDIMFLLFVAAHELTHQKRNLDVANGKLLDGAIVEINRALQEGNGRSDYTRNHDADEIEIDADENAWIICAEFAEKFIKDKSISQKCRENAKAVNMRRAFSLKIDKDGKTHRYIDYDVEQLMQIIKNKPQILQKHRFLSEIFDEKGRIKTNFLFEEIITNTKAGRAFCNYTLNKVPIKLLRQKIESGEYSEKQIKTLLENFVQVPHANALVLRGLNQIDLETFSETNTGVKGGKDAILFDLYNNSFVECAEQLMRFSELLDIVSNILSKEIIDNFFEFFTQYYVEMAINVKFPNDYFIYNVLMKLEQSESIRLKTLASKTFEYFKRKTNVDLKNDMNITWFRTPQLNELSIKPSRPAEGQFPHQ